MTKTNAGRPPAWSRSGCKAVPPNSTTFEKEYYRPSDGMFQSGVNQLNDLDDAFDVVRNAPRETRSEFQHNLYEIFTERRETLRSKHKNQTQTGLEAEQMLKTMKSKQEQIKQIQTSEATQYPTGLQTTPDELFDKVKEQDEEDIKKALSDYLTSYKMNFTLVQAQHDVNVLQSKHKTADADFKRLYRETRKIWSDLTILRDELVDDTSRKHQGLPSKTIDDVADIKEQLQSLSQPSSQQSSPPTSPAHQLVRNSTAPMLCPYSNGDAIEYKNSKDIWMSGIFLEPNDNGTYKLNIKPAADPSRVRRDYSSVDNTTQGVDFDMTDEDDNYEDANSQNGAKKRQRTD